MLDYDHVEYIFDTKPDDEICERFERLGMEHGFAGEWYVFKGALAPREAYNARRYVDSLRKKLPDNSIMENHLTV